MRFNGSILKLKNVANDVIVIVMPVLTSKVAANGLEI